MTPPADMPPPVQTVASLPMTCVRLRGREALWVLAFAALVWLIAPRMAGRLTEFSFQQANYRTPYEASEDYWRFRQLAEQATTQRHVLMLGDSVIWGEYVAARDALPAILNRTAGDIHFVNGGINGMHPLALTGLVGDYARAVRDRPVFLHCNLLWLSSAERDLSADSRLSFNHPRLIPQFTWRIPGYQADTADRLSILVERHVQLRQWVRHLWIGYLGGQDLPHWTLEHPAEWPQPLPDADTSLTRQSSAAWTQRGIRPQAYDWVPLEESLQWRAFRETVEILQQRGNRVFVLVGPFNAHLLTAESRVKWQDARRGIVAWLASQGVAHLAPDVLPSQLYADASHPLAAGYEQLSEQLLGSPSFRDWRSAVPDSRE